MSFTTNKKAVLILLISLVAIAAGWLQYNTFTLQQQALRKAMAELQPQKAELLSVLYKSETFHQQLALAQQRYAQLRVLIPVDDRICAFQDNFKVLVQKYALKILAQKHAVNSKSLYREVQCAYTLEGDDAAAKKLLAEINRSPRLLKVSKYERTDKKHIEITITMYAVAAGDEPVAEAIDCMEPPGNYIFIPRLKQELTQTHAEYLDTCEFLVRNADLEKDILRYRYLKGQIAYLEDIVDKLRSDI